MKTLILILVIAVVILASGFEPKKFCENLGKGARIVAQKMEAKNSDNNKTQYTTVINRNRAY